MYDAALHILYCCICTLQSSCNFNLKTKLIERTGTPRFFSLGRDESGIVLGLLAFMVPFVYVSVQGNQRRLMDEMRNGGHSEGVKVDNHASRFKAHTLAQPWRKGIRLQGSGIDVKGEKLCSVQPNSICGVANALPPDSAGLHDAQVQDCLACIQCRDLQGTATCSFRAVIMT